MEKLLINCQCLDGLVIGFNMYNWNNLFKILTRSSPTGLFKFKFSFSEYAIPNSESLKSFFDGWKGRHPMLLQFISEYADDDLTKRYRTEGIIKKYDKDNDGDKFDQFEWIHQKKY